MGISTNTNTELYSMLNQIQGMTSNTKVGNFFNAGDINSIWTAGEQIVEGNAEEKQSGLQSLISKIISIAVSQANAAKEEVKNNEKSAKELDKSVNQTNKKISKELNKLEKGINKQTKIVTKSTEKLDKYSEKLEKQQKEVERIIEEIQQKQAELAKTTDPEKQKELLNEIKGLSGGLAAVVEAVTKISEDINEVKENADTAKAEIDSIQQEQESVTEEGQQEITQDVQNATQNVQTNVKTETEGIADTQASIQLQEAATSSGIVPVVGSVASAELQQKAIDLGQAGSTRQVGATSCLGQLSTSINNLKNNGDLLTQLNTTIVGALNNFDDLFGAWNGKVDPLIKSVGSIVNEDGIGATSTNLDKAVEADMKKIKEGTSNNKNNDNQDNDDLNESSDEQVNDLETPDIEVKKPEFGL